jgi:hypothetical protein
MVMGWSVNFESIGFLIPMTIVNLAALIVLVMAMISAKGGGNGFDPLKPHALLLMAAVHNAEEDQPVEWEHTVKYRSEVRESPHMAGLIVKPIWPLGVKERSFEIKDRATGGTEGRCC